VFVGKLLLPFDDRGRFGELGDFIQRLDEIGPVHHRHALHIVAKTRRVRVLADIGALAHLLDDVFLDAELGAMEDLDLQPALGPLLHPLGPFLKAGVIRLGGGENMIEAQREILGQGRRRRERPNCKRGAKRDQCISQAHHCFLHAFPNLRRSLHCRLSEDRRGFGRILCSFIFVTYTLECQCL
jgi:hypothetical protein